MQFIADSKETVHFGISDTKPSRYDNSEEMLPYVQFILPWVDTCFHLNIPASELSNESLRAIVKEQAKIFSQVKSQYNEHTKLYIVLIVPIKLSINPKVHASHNP